MLCRQVLWLCDFFYNFEEVSSSFKFENFDQILKFSYVDNVAEDFLTVSFTKVEHLRKLADAKCLEKRVSMNLVGNKSLALELGTVSQFIYKRSGYGITVYSNYTVTTPRWNPPWRDEGAYVTKRFHPSTSTSRARRSDAATFDKD